ncbi:MAG: monophosphatase [Actinomycetota bacterium]|nr:monophosphatase [Actinomycetota bacterium]
MLFDLRDITRHVDDCHAASVGPSSSLPKVTSDLLDVLHTVADAVHVALGQLDDWSLAGTRPGQYRSDLAADEAALVILERAGLGVLSEESGLHHAERDVLVVMDPVDGSTNADRGIPWYATSLCAVDGEGPLAAVVANQASGVRFEATRGGGASCEGVPLVPSGCGRLADAIVGLSGYPSTHLGWRQFRALGAAALDLCAVAAGTLDAYIDCSLDAHGPWDYLGGAFVCQEAGAAVADLHGRDLVALGYGDRRTVLAANSGALLTEVSEVRRKLVDGAAGP